MTGDDDFLSRWSRRKRSGPEEEPQSLQDAAPPAEPDPRSDEEILAELGLKHPDALEPGDDVRGFMQAAVPDRLRRLALRQLWRSNPVLANVDGLVEYGEDYTDAATVIENMQTLYQVGKGMLRDLTEDKAPEADEVVAEKAVAEVEAEAETEPEPEPVEEPEVAREEELAEAPLEQGRTTRRMAFRFD